MIVKIQANASESLLATNNSPNIHVPPSNGKSAKTLMRITLLYKLMSIAKYVHTISFTVLNLT